MRFQIRAGQRALKPKTSNKFIDISPRPGQNIPIIHPPENSVADENLPRPSPGT